MSNTVVECRNQEALVLEPAHQPGDWITNIQEKVLIEEGDSIICRNAFIDSRATTSNKIIIQEEQECKITFCRYLRNYRGAVNTYASGPPATANVDTATSQIIPINPLQNVYVAQNDNLDYVQCTQQTLPNTSYKFIGSITYSCIDIFEPSGGVNLCAQYFNESGVVISTKINIPRTFNGLGPFKAPCAITYDASKNGADAPPGNDGRAIAIFFIQGDDFDPIIPDTTDGPLDGLTRNRGVIAPGAPNALSRTVIHLVNGTGSVVPADNFFAIQNSMEFTVPVANYDPDELCEVINRQLTSVSPGSTDITNLSGDNQFLDQIGGGQNTSNNFFVRIQDGSVQNPYGCQINNTAGFTQFVGANEVVLSYDDATQKFFWEFIHFPIYDSTNGPSVALLSVRTDFTVDASPQRSFIANKNSGVIFTNFESNPKGQPKVDSSFFQDILGLDTALTNADGTTNTNCILATISHKQNSTATGNYTVNGSPSGVPIFDRVPKDGVETTGEFIGIDQGVDKTQGHDSSYKPLTLTANNQGSPQFSTSDKTIPIEAVSSVLGSIQKIDFGYFLVEVKAQFENDFRTPNDKKANIVAIVSRYYELNSFTSSDQGNSLVYTHKGQPLLLSSFHCRILDSEKQLSANIGKDNTVFLEIVKAPAKKPDKK